MLFRIVAIACIMVGAAACDSKTDDGSAPPPATETTRVKGMAVTQGNTTYIFITDRKDKLLAYGITGRNRQG